MDATQSQRSRMDVDSTHDYITNLPENVKENILVKLPIKEAVRTSILSSKWVNSWVSIPNLVFEGYRIDLTLIEMVDTVLLFHQGLIQKFKLCMNSTCDEAIGRWLLTLSRNGIKDLDLSGYKCKIPSRLISCSVLERLCLTYCSINIPLYFEGFKQLRTLILLHCDLLGISIENIVSSCPLLDHLDVRTSDPPQGQVRISAPNLTCLKIAASFNDICLETPKLASANIRLFSNVARNRKESNIVRAFGHLANIQKLEIDGQFFRYLAAGPIPENLPTVFNHLTDLIVHGISIKSNEISAALCIFGNAPNLKEVYIEFRIVDQPDVDVAWESKRMQDHLFKNLKDMTIVCEFKYDIEYKYRLRSLQTAKSVLGFAKLVLSTAPVLEKLCFMGLYEAEIFFEMLKWFPKSSKNAEIIFEEPPWD